MNKEVKFLMKFDTSEFDQAIERMQRQLREVYRPADNAIAQRQTASRLEGLGLGGAMSKPSMEATYKSIQTARTAMGAILKEQSREADKLLRDLTKHSQEEERLVKLQKEKVKGSQEELAIIQQIEKIKNNIYQAQEQFGQRQKTIQQGADAMQNLAPKDKLERMLLALGGGGMRGGLKEAGMMGGEWWKGLGMTGQAGAIIGGLIAAAKGVGVAGDIATAYSGVPLQVASAQGSATQNTFGRPIQSAFAGTQLQDLAFRAHYSKEAAAKAEEQIRTQQHWDQIVTGQWALKTAAKSGLPPDAALSLGMIGTVQSAVGATGLLGERRQSLVAGQFNQRMADKYTALTAEQYAEQYTKMIEDLKKQDPLTTATVEGFANRREGDLAFQRSTGLNYDTFHGTGGFREKSVNSGFMDTQGMAAAQGIIGAGGSTRGATGNAILSMQAQRGFDLTNANEVIGRLSGRMGGSESTNQAFVRMLAEGTRLGLDSSNYVEENRRFMDAASSIIQQSGTGSQAAIADLLQRFGGFVGENRTPAGIEAAKGAFQAYNQATSQTAGPQGALRAAAFLADPVLSKMSGQEQSELAGIDSTHMTVDHPTVKSLARKYGVSPQSIVDAHQKAGGASAFRRPETDALIKSTMKMRDELENMPGTDLASNRRREALRSQISDAEDTLGGKMGWELGLGNQPMQEKALAEGVTRPGGKAVTEDEILAEQKRLGDKTGTGRPEDAAAAAAAESSRLMVTSFQQLHDTIIPSAAAVAEFNTQMIKLLTTLRNPNASAADKAAAQDAMSRLMPKQQSTSR
jgi:hypothetical protein